VLWWPLPRDESALGDGQKTAVRVKSRTFTGPGNPQLLLVRRGGWCAETVHPPRHPLKPRVFVHIGTHKTGSTAIQQAFASGADGLVRLGFRDDIARSTWTESDTGHLADHLRAQITPVKPVNYLLSTERFCGEPLQGYAEAGTIARRVQGITRDFDPMIVVFLRRQDDFIESLYTQMIHQGGSQTFPEFLETIRPEIMNWHRLLEAYAAVFGRENIIVRRYHPDFYPESRSLLADFCQIVGVDPAKLPAGQGTGTPNQGYSKEAMDIALLCNPHLDDTGRRHLRQLLQKISPKPVFQSYGYLDLPLRRQILAACAESNAAVCRDFLPHLPGHTPLFPEPVASEGAAAADTKGAEPLVPVLVKMLIESRERQRGSRVLRLAFKLDSQLGRLRQLFSKSPLL